MEEKDIKLLMESFIEDIHDADNIRKGIKLAGNLIPKSEESEYINTQLILALAFIKEFLRHSSSCFRVSNTLFEWMCARAYEVAHNLGKELEERI